MIPSPYNFVPLWDKIFFPGWASQVSMDIPFSDGISGCLEITIQAETDLYTRNSGTRKDSKEWQDFFEVIPGSGQYALNGSTVKGMLRSIIEIASFGKFRQLDAHADQGYVYRDLRDETYNARFVKNLRIERIHELKKNRKIEIKRETNTALNQEFGSNIQGKKQFFLSKCYESKAKAGWLTSNRNEWLITPCDYARIPITELNEYAGISDDKTHLFRKSSSVNKYCFWCVQKDDMIINFLYDYKIYDHYYARGGRNKYIWLCYKKAHYTPGRGQQGVIVFTGQPQTSNKNERRKKKMESIFFDQRPNDSIKVQDEIFKRFVYCHSTNGEPNKEWQFWLDMLKNGETDCVPIFYLVDEQSGQLSSFGLAMMFRQQFTYSVKELVKKVNPLHLKEYPLDLAETMFGAPLEPDSLKGRISVEPFLERTNSSLQRPGLQQRTLLAPRPGCYLTYLQQCTDENGLLTGARHSTYNDHEAKPAGAKRYPVAKAARAPLRANDADNPNIMTKFKPLPRGTTFIGSIRIHNLRPVELGALVWALTWGGDASLRHNIGMAKPYGFGTIKVSINGHDLMVNATRERLQDTERCCDLFVQEMSNFDPGWMESEQIDELLAMANPAKFNERLHHYPLTQDFARFKGANQNRKEGLTRYSKRDGHEN